MAASAAIAAGVSHEGPTWTVATGKGEVAVTPLTDNIFHIATFSRKGAEMLPASQSAVLEPGAPSIRTALDDSSFWLYSPTTTVRVDRFTGRVSFMTPDGDTLLSEAGGIDNSGDVKTVTFTSRADETFYGAGERGHRLRLNGDSLSMYNRQNYGYTGSDPRISQMGISVPYFASDAGYGVLFDDYNRAALELRDTITYTSDTPLPLSYYFINGGKTLAGTTEGYTRLTGRQDLPPFWALGYVTSKYGYHNQKEALGAVDSLKTRGYPLDGIVFDLYWYGVETDMGRLAWDTTQWPDHRGMIRDLDSLGVNLVMITQPYVNKKGAIDNYNYLSERGMLAKDSLGRTHDVTTWVGDAGMIDVSNPETREWLWQRLRPLTEEGVYGWWGDLGEPEVHPLYIRHANGQTASQYHNVYGNEWSRILYEGLRRDFPDRRPLLMMRGGTAGLQRYSVFPWTTDVSRSWGGLEPQVNLMLSSGLSGLAYMSSDLGGFAVDPAHPIDPELYVRWVGMGAFTPFMRTHAQLMPEPYHYPGQEPIIKKFIRMRYEWLPYNYTLAYENAAFGYPLARPLNFRGDNPDRRYAALSDEYLWGDNVLVAPVMKKGATSRKVLFPAGEWIDWRDASRRYRGGTEATLSAPLSDLPLFVKAGSFIPQYPDRIENVRQYDPSRLWVRYYPADTVTRYTLYDDNRLSPTSLADGDYQLINFSGSRAGGAISVQLSSEGKYAGMPAVRMITFEIPGVARPSQVMLGDIRLEEAVSPKAIRQYGYSYDQSTRTLYVRFPFDGKPATFSAR